MGRPSLHRRTFWINRSLQGGIVLGVLAATGFSVLLMGVDYYLTFGRRAPGGPWDPDMMWIFFKSHQSLLFQLFVFVVALTLVTVVLTHRLAGPLFNLMRVMSRVGEGDLTSRAHFRRTDALGEMRDVFNQMVEDLRQRVAQDRESVKMVLQMLDLLRDDPGLSPENKIRLLRLREEVERLTKTFTLS